jgi:hypothetical protein
MFYENNYKKQPFFSIKVSSLLIPNRDFPVKNESVAYSHQCGHVFTNNIEDKSFIGCKPWQSYLYVIARSKATWQSLREKCISFFEIASLRSQLHFSLCHYGQLKRE